MPNLWVVSVLWCGPMVSATRYLCIATWIYIPRYRPHRRMPRHHASTSPSTLLRSFKIPHRYTSVRTTR